MTTALQTAKTTVDEIKKQIAALQAAVATYENPAKEIDWASVGTLTYTKNQLTEINSGLTHTIAR